MIGQSGKDKGKEYGTENGLLDRITVREYGANHPAGGLVLTILWRLSKAYNLGRENTTQSRASVL